MLEKLKARLTELAHGEQAEIQSETQLQIKHAKLQRLDADLAAAK